MCSARDSAGTRIQIPAYAGMTGGDAGCDAMGAYARVQIPAYAGMTWVRCGNDVMMGAGCDVMGGGNARGLASIMRGHRHAYPPSRHIPPPPVIPA